jgi:hypothetical protein
MNTWNPREEILAAAHRWYWLVLAFLLGALLGWLVNFIWPAPYRAALDVYVGLNLYRSAHDPYIAEAAQIPKSSGYLNPDDYKHAQMSQLTALAFSDDYLGEALARLQAEDPAWADVDVPALREMLSIGWRNTGEWHFAATHADPQRAAQAVSAWVDVTTEKTSAAVEAAREVVIIDSELNAVAAALVDAELDGRTADAAALEARHNELAAGYNDAVARSRALAAALEVGPIKDAPPEVVHLRPTATLMLVGGLLGMLSLFIFWLVQISRSPQAGGGEKMAESG